VFDRFYRADPSRSSAGTGLGLSLIKSIAHLHGGSAQIESELGRGTIVALIFPKRA
jgi:signal transduction histidine kinase